IFALREAGELAAIRAELRYPVKHRHREHRLGATGTTGRDEGVAQFAGGRTVLGDAFKIPVEAAIGRIELPVVAGTGVAAVAIERRVEVVQLRAAGVGDAIDIRADRMPVRIGIDIDT